MPEAKQKRVKFPFRKCDDAAIRLGREAEIARYYREVGDTAAEIRSTCESADCPCWEGQAHDAAERATIYTAEHYCIIHLSENVGAIDEYTELIPRSVNDVLRDIAYWAYYTDVMQALDRLGEAR
ncbi:MAG: hypothetical protein IPK74_40065 [Deltaproteobacteria bacterium]|nr:hypothetical protein [Deltaproteobacteria bacterium]